MKLQEGVARGGSQDVSGASADAASQRLTGRNFNFEWTVPLNTTPRHIIYKLPPIGRACPVKAPGCLCLVPLATLHSLTHTHGSVWEQRELHMTSTQERFWGNGCQGNWRKEVVQENASHTGGWIRRVEVLFCFSASGPARVCVCYYHVIMFWVASLGALVAGPWTNEPSLKCGIGLVALYSTLSAHD